MAVSENQTEAASFRNHGEGVATIEKPRARLGETELVQLHNSDSENEGQAVEVSGDGGDAFNDPDFLKDYPDDTTVSVISVSISYASLKPLLA